MPLQLFRFTILAVVCGCAVQHLAAQQPQALPDLGQLEVMANSGRATEVLTQLAETSPGTPAGPAHRVRGVALYALNRLPEADKEFAAALAANPADQEAEQMRGLTLFRMGRPADAIPLLERSHAEGVQKKADPTYVLALCYVDTRRYDDARAAYAMQYGLPPDSAAAYLLAGRMLLRREYLPVAQRFAREAIQRNPSLPLAHELMGEIALAGNDLDVAKVEFEAEIKGNPLEPASYERLGDLLSRQGDYGAAQIALQRAVLLEPNATGPYILLGRTALRQNDPVAALTFLQRAVTMDPSSAMTHTLLAQAYRAVNRPGEASREMETVQKLHTAEEPTLTTVK